MDIYIWLGITVLALVVEALTNELITIWFAVGGLVSIILSAFGVQWYISTPIFLAISFALVLSLRKISLKLLNKNNERINADAVFGKEFMLLSGISLNKAGTIKVNDVVWNVATENQQDVVPEGTLVEILYLKGNKYIVKPIKQNSQESATTAEN